jgi:hypothetical protein
MARDPTVLLWPAYPGPSSVALTIDRPMFKGPPPLSGREQVVVSTAGAWKLDLKLVPVFPNVISEFRAFWARLGGKAQPIYVGPVDYVNSPSHRLGVATPVLSAFSTGAIFSNGAKFSRRTSDCILFSAAPLAATSITALNSVSAPVRPGDYIEISGRLHVIDGVSPDPNIIPPADYGLVNDTAISSQKDYGLVIGSPISVQDYGLVTQVSTSGVSLFSLWPPTRAAYPAGTPIEIDDPRFLAYLTVDSQSLVQDLSFFAYGECTFQFIEATW